MAHALDLCALGLIQELLECINDDSDELLILSKRVLLERVCECSVARHRLIAE